MVLDLFFMLITMLAVSVLEGSDMKLHTAVNIKCCGYMRYSAHYLDQITSIPGFTEATTGGLAALVASKIGPVR